MIFTLKDIKGAVLEPRNTFDSVLNNGDNRGFWFDYAIEEQAKVPLRFRYAKIMELLGQVYCLPAHSKKIVDPSLMLDICNALIAAEKEIVECAK